MARTIAQLRKTPDEVLITEHDELAPRTIVGTAYYEDELDRRSRERSTTASQELARSSLVLARKTLYLTIASTLLSVVATVTALVAVFLRS